MDYNRKTGEWRMLEKFLPTDTQSARAAKVDAAKKARKEKTPAKKKKGPQKDEDADVNASIYAWLPEVGVHCVAWNPNGLSKSQLLASGTASGLCRIDNLWGWRTKTNNARKIESDEDIDMEDSDD